ncbi:HD domain-containing protein [candidate division GN15 bacterium]|nr:HD domain-containing protein [candidate division GN15 bacterium]
MNKAMSSDVQVELARVLGGPEEERLVNAFFVMYKTARIIDATNAMFARQADAFIERLRALRIDRRDITVKRVSRRFFVNDRMVRFNEAGNVGADVILTEWKLLGLAGVKFSSRLERQDLIDFVVFLAGLRVTEENVEQLAERVRTCSLQGIELLSVQQIEEELPAFSDAVRARFRRSARESFFRAMAVAEDLILSASTEREVNMSKTRRVVQGLIEHILKDESSLIELTAIRDYDDYTYAHSTNVCVYALTLGVQLGLDRPRLSQLGFSALFHDVGKVKLPEDLIRKPDRFNENDWQQIRQHPLLGAKTILRHIEHDVYAARAARTAFEHHLGTDLTGYPQQVLDQRRPSLFSRIVTIADTFDALTSGRVYIKEKITPAEALRRMHTQQGQKYDQLLLKLFIDMVGIYPPGSMVLLSTREVALVVATNRENPLRPYVRIIGNESGLLDIPEWVDLSDLEHKKRKIVRMIDPRKYGLRASDYILSD